VAIGGQGLAWLQLVRGRRRPRRPLASDRRRRRESLELAGRSFRGSCRAVGRGHGLSRAKAGDGTRPTWLAFLTSLEAVPGRELVGAWFAAKTRHECLRFLGYEEGRSGQLSSGWVSRDRAIETTDDPAMPVRDEALWSTFEALEEDGPCLLGLPAAEPLLGYAELSAGSATPADRICPARARRLDASRDRAVLCPHHSKARRTAVGAAEGRVQ
jgi:hypothetical protein